MCQVALTGGVGRGYLAGAASSRRNGDALSPYEVIAEQIGRLVVEKQAAYGDAHGRAGEVMRVLYPNGIPPEKMDDALAVVRVVDKLFRIATDRDALGESPWRDIAGYGILGAARAVTRAATTPAPAESP
jgi:hypothetical protein